MTQRKAMIASSIALALVLAGCGGGSGGSGSTPVAVAPSPAPTPSPTPSPTPTPAPQSLAGRIGSDRLLNILRPGDSIEGPLVCAAGNFTYARDANGARRLAGVSSITGVNIGISLAIFAGQSGSLSFDFNGFGGPTFSETNRLSAPNALMRAYRTATDEVQLFDNSWVATAGFYNGGDDVCFFTAGPDLSAGFAPFERDVANVDGIAIVGGRAHRLLESRVTDWATDEATGSLAFTIDFMGASPAFAETPSETSNLGRVRVRASPAGERFEALAGDLRVAPDSRLDCVAYVRDHGIGCTYDLRLENGDRLFGAISVDARLI